MTSKFDKPFLEKNTYDLTNVGNLFNLANNLDLEGLRRESLVNKIPLNIVNNNENLIHVVVRVNSINEEKKIKIVNYLISKGAHPDLNNNEGVTPLHYACEKQNSKLIGLLLKYGCNPNSKDNFGRTPLHYLLSGLIKEWIKKENKALFYRKRAIKNENQNEKVLALKSIIYEKLKERRLDDEIRNLLSGLNLEDLKINLPELNMEYDMNSSFSLKDLEEKQRTRIYNIKENLDNIFNFEINNVIIKSENNEIEKINLLDFINNNIKLEKIFLIETLNKYTRQFKLLKNSCLNLKNANEMYKNRGTVISDSEYILNNKISPFYPLVDFDNELFISNKTTKIIYTKMEEGILNEILLENKLNQIIKLYDYSFENNGILNAIDLSDLNIEIGESLNSIREKLVNKGLLKNETNKDKLKSLILLSIILYLYNPKDIELIFELNYNRFINDNGINEFISEKMKTMIKNNSFEEFIFELFYYLIEQNIIEKRMDNGLNRLYSSSLYLLKMIIDFENINLSEIVSYETGELSEDNEDKLFINLETSDTIKSSSLIGLEEDYFNIITEDYKSNLETDEGRIFGDNNERIYFIKRYEWILPSLKEILGYHYLIDKLTLIELNQAIYVRRILGLKFLSKSPSDKLNEVVSTIYPSYVEGTNMKQYINKLSIGKIINYNICKLYSIYKNLLNNGNYPLLKIMSLEEDNFNKYFNKIVPYHLKNILLLNNLKNIQMSNPYVTLKSFNIELRMFETIINNISILNYIKIRLTTESDILEIPSFYYYTNRESENYYPLLSYGVEEDSIEKEELEDDLMGEYIKPKININKLRISKNELPPSLKTPIGYNLLLKLTILKNLEINEEIINFAENILEEIGFLKENTSELIDNQVNILNKLYKEIINSIVERQLKLLSINKLNESNEVLTKLKNEFSEDITFLKSTDLSEIKVDDEEERKISIFPIIKENEVKIPELYFSNDYTIDSFIETVYEIKFDSDCLNLLINHGCNPFLVDNLEQSAIHMLATNYLLKPFNSLIELGIDFRQQDENGYSFNNKIEQEIEYHKNFIDTSKNNFREIIKDLIDPFYEKIKTTIDNSYYTGFNHLRYTRLALELSAYYILVDDVDILSELTYPLYESDLVLAKKLVSPEKDFKKIRRLRIDLLNENILERHIEFSNSIFIDAPGVFLEGFESVFKSKKLIENLDNIKPSTQFGINYFINNKTTNIPEINEINKILKLVGNEVLTTQIIYLLTNLINSHLKMKFIGLNGDDRVRIIEDILQNKILEGSEENYKFLNLIRNNSLPKLIQNITKIYNSINDLENPEDFSIREFVDDIISSLKLIPEYFDSDDKLIDEILPNMFNNYLELYLPLVISSMRQIIENILRWKINYDKLQQLKL